MVSKHLFNGLAFCSPLHPRAPRNLRALPPRALRSVGLDSSTLRTAYLRRDPCTMVWKPTRSKIAMYSVQSVLSSLAESATVI